MTDTHTHIYMKDSFPSDSMEVARRALEQGVGRMIFPAVDLKSFPDLTELASMFPGNIGIAIGIHPTELAPSWKEDLDRMFSLAGNIRPVAIGEVGIDLHWDASTEELQKEAFLHQLGIALKMGLPVIIHSRDALPQTLDTIEKFKEDHNGELPTLVFHSFTGSAEDVKRIRSVCSPWFGINGVVTFRNARELQEAVPEIGLHRILLETDSPYLAPVPFRGKRNESAYLPAIAEKIASLLHLPAAEVEKATDLNAERTFPGLANLQPAS